MRPNDIFEAFTDIDDKFIAAAHPAEYDDGQPVVVQPAPKKSLWKTLVPTAACLAVLCTAGAFGARYFLTRPNAETSDPYTSSNGYTSEAVTDINSMGYRAGLKEIKINAADEQKYFGMEEFPEYRFGAFNTGVVMFSMDLGIETTALIDGEVQDLCLCDLNGDGKRELCSTVYMEAQEEYRQVTDQRIMAYDYANGKLYELADRGQYDYHIEIEGGYDGFDYRVYAVKTKYPKYGTNDTYPIWSKELTLYLMTEVAKPDMEIMQSYKGVLEYKPGSTFYMDEFSLTRFDISATGIDMTRNGGTTENIFATNDHIEKVYLADLNLDGRREIIIESYTRPLKSPSMTLGEPEKMLSYLDIENETGVNLWPPKLHADISLTIDDGHLHIVYDGKKDPTVLSTGRFDALAKSEGWDLDQWQEMY